MFTTAIYSGHVKMHSFSSAIKNTKLVYQNSTGKYETMDNGCSDFYGEVKIFFPSPFGCADVNTRDVHTYKHSSENIYLTQIE